MRMQVPCVCVLFFSSRRRHTRYWRDWSSDVCSSDLIAVASSEQSAGVGEINKAILQLETVTQQNAALVEQAAASSLTFQEQADRMRDLVEIGRASCRERV